MIFIFASPAGFTAEPVTASRAEKIEVDGRLDEPAWQEAEEYTIEFSASGEAPSVGTSFRILWDADNLYLGVVAEQPDMDALRTIGADRTSAIWSDDCIQFFIDPSGTGGPYFQFIVNAAGSTWEARYRRGRDTVADWQARDVEAAVQLGETSWTLEMRIPFHNLLSRHEDAEPEVAVDTWRFELTRTYSGDGPRLLSYSGLSDLFDTGRYARLGGIDIDYGVYRWQLGPVALKEVVPQDDGSYRVELNLGINNRSDRFRAFSLAGEMETADGKIKPFLIAEQFGADAGENPMLPFAIDVLQSGAVPLTVSLYELSSGRKIHWNRFDVNVDTSPLELTILHPYYRSAIYHDMEVDAVRLGLGMLWTVGWGEGDALRIRIIDAAGRTVSERLIKDAGKFAGEHELAIPQLEFGEYKCLAEVIREGRPLYAAETSLYVYPPSESLVRVNEHRNIVINGRETFLVGTFHSPWQTYQGENCNIALTYGIAPDIDENPAVRESLERGADLGRWMLRFPYPRELWPHQVGGRAELRMRPLPRADALKISERVAQYRDVRGKFGWYLADEPNTHVFLPSYLEGVADAVREGDPYHPAYISFNNAGTIRHYTNACDLLGVHWYVNFRDEGPERALSTVADHIKLAHELTDYRKAVINSPLFWMYAHSGNVRMPTHDETRCMAYLGIVHGARGVIWYSISGFNVGTEPRLGMPVLIDELRALEPVFLAHRDIDIPVEGSEAGAIHTLGKQVDNELYIIAVNAEPAEVKAALGIPEEWGGIREIREIDADGEKHTVNAGQLELIFSPYEVRIFSTADGAPRLVSRRQVNRRFEAEHERLMALGDLCYSGRGATIHPTPDFGRFAMVRMLIDGHYNNDYSFLPRDMKKGSHVEIRFPEQETVGRIDVYTPERYALRSYILEIKTGEGWRKVEGEITEELLDDPVFKDRSVIRREHRFPDFGVEALRLIMTEDARRPRAQDSLRITAIKAYAP